MDIIPRITYYNTQDTSNDVMGSVPKIIMLKIKQPSSKLPVEIVRHLNRRKQQTHELSHVLCQNKANGRVSLEDNIFVKKEA
jgi:hypothetical protein